MKASELIAALEDGKAIFLDYKYAFPERNHHTEIGENVQVIRFYEGTTKIYRYGWGSAIGTEIEILEDIIQHPEKYQISNNL